MKYLRKFENHTQYEEARQNLVLPNVSYIVEGNGVHYEPVPPPFFCKLTLNNGEVVELEGSGELTSAMVSDQYSGTLVSAEIGELCTSIGGGAFRDCSGLTSITIGSGVTSIGNSAFWACSGLTSITIPDSVTSINSSAFNNCTGLTSIVVDSANTVYDSRNNCNAIINTLTNELIAGCKNTIIPNSVTEIGDRAFGGCTGLTNIIIPDSVTSIGGYVFSSCSGLTSIDIPSGVTSIGNYAFYRCSGLTSITIPDSVTSVGDYAFQECTGLTSVTIGSGVTSISRGTFTSCTGLTSVTIGSGVTSISSAFSGCTNLFTITSHIMNAPSVYGGTFVGVKYGGTLYVPKGSSGYETWMNNQGNLGSFNWTKVEQ